MPTSSNSNPAKTAHSGQPAATNMQLVDKPVHGVREVDKTRLDNPPDPTYSMRRWLQQDARDEPFVLGVGGCRSWGEEGGRKDGQ